MSSLPKSIQAARKAYAGGGQDLEEAPKVAASPPKYSKSHLARSRSSSPLEESPGELNASSLPPSPSGLQHPRFRSDSVQNELTASSPPSKSQSPEPIKYPVEVESAEYLPPGFKILPKSCYNYQPFEPPPPPPVLPCSRAWLYSQIVSTSRPVFLSCNLTNPIHLASVIAFGQKWSVTKTVAGNMTPAVRIEWMEDLQAWKGVFGVLICGLSPHSMELLEAARGRKDGYERTVEDVAVEADDGGEVQLAAYVYRKSAGNLPDKKV